MGQILSNIAQSICGGGCGAEEEERISGLESLISPPRLDLRSKFTSDCGLQKPLLVSPHVLRSSTSAVFQRNQPTSSGSSVLHSDSGSNVASVQDLLATPQSLDCGRVFSNVDLCITGYTSGYTLRKNPSISPLIWEPFSDSSTTNAFLPTTPPCSNSDSGPERNVGLQHKQLISLPSVDSRSNSSTNGALQKELMGSPGSFDSCGDLSNVIEDDRQDFPFLPYPSPCSNSDSASERSVALQHKLLMSLLSLDSCNNSNTNGALHKDLMGTPRSIASFGDVSNVIEDDWQESPFLPDPPPCSKSDSTFERSVALQHKLFISLPSLDSCTNSSTHGALQKELSGNPWSSASCEGLSNVIEADRLDSPFLPESKKKRRQRKIESRQVHVELDREYPVKEIWITHYCSHHKLLLVGEGDFSFSASLALAFGSAINMIATSLDSLEFLSKNYRNALDNIADLKFRGCTVVHGIDATQMENSCLLKGLTFDRIVFNFPHAGFFRNESQKSQIRRHQKLVSLFLKNAKGLILKEGEIHISHKSNGFHRQWNLEHLASSVGLHLKGQEHFALTDYPGYNTKYGYGGDKNFNCNPSRTYKFGLKSAKNKMKNY